MENKHTWHFGNCYVSDDSYSISLTKDINEAKIYDDEYEMSGLQEEYGGMFIELDDVDLETMGIEEDNYIRDEISIEDVEVKFDKTLLTRLIESFPKAFINRLSEFIVEPSINTYFRLEDVNNKLELECKVLEFCSRSAYKVGHQYSKDYHLNGINNFLGTQFNEDDMETIYTPLGNGNRRELCKKFIKSNYNFKILEER